ncbi:MAG: DUF1045 domain-containing protein [Rhodobacteraceae bacterium]|nr:DUF1045 domain-containing protein [Paracoccaceae bacterium]
MNFKRYAVYYTPQDDLFYNLGSSWLGWDTILGQPVSQPEVNNDINIEKITETPRKYGLHATIKAPFRLADGLSASELARQLRTLCLSLKPIEFSLEVSELNGFFAFTPTVKNTELRKLHSKVVRELDYFRAQPTKEEIIKRRENQLTSEQDQNLIKWGYPYIFEDFYFHITLTGKIPEDFRNKVKDEIENFFQPVLQQKINLSELALVGEAKDGNFYVIRQMPLALKT